MGGSPALTPDALAVGTVVPASEIKLTAMDSTQLHFGLANIGPGVSPPSTYPAISTDGGATWKIDGPEFWVAAADGPEVVSSGGALGSEGAYFWGQGGNVVHVTTDEGLEWWTSGFPAGVDKVSASHGILHTVALGGQVDSASFQAFLYQSKDFGRVWTFVRKLPDVKL